MSKTTTKLLHNTTYLMSKKNLGTISEEQTLKRRAIKRFCTPERLQWKQTKVQGMQKKSELDW